MNAYVVVIFFDKDFLSIKETGGETLSSSSNIGAGFEASSCCGRISYEPELRVWSENWLFLSIEMLPKLRIDGEFVGSCKSLQVYENRLKCDVSRLRAHPRKSVFLAIFPGLAKPESVTSPYIYLTTTKYIVFKLERIR